MIEIKFPCPVCGQNIACDETHSGSAINCPACREALTVPNAREWQAISAPDVFIIFRKGGGDYLAGLVGEGLRQRNFEVFADAGDEASGASNLAGLKKIELASDVLVMFTPGCFDGCQNEKDPVRRQIRHAIRKGKNIVPIMDRHFAPPPNGLPADIAEVQFYNGMTPVTELWEESMNRLAADFLQSKSRALASRTKLELARARPLAMFGAVVGAFGILIALACLPQLNHLIAYRRYPNLVTISKVAMTAAVLLNLVLLAGTGLLYGLKETGLKLLNSIASALMLANTGCSVAYIVAARGYGFSYLGAAGPPVLICVVTIVPLLLLTQRAGKLLRQGSLKN